MICVSLQQLIGLSDKHLADSFHMCIFYVSYIKGAMFQENSLRLILPDLRPDTLDRSMACSHFYLHASILVFSGREERELRMFENRTWC